MPWLRLLKAHPVSHTTSPAGPSIEPVRQPRLQFIEHIVLGGGLQARMPEGLLRLADIALGQLRADEVPHIVRLDGPQAG